MIIIFPHLSPLPLPERNIIIGHMQSMRRVIFSGRRKILHLPLFLPAIGPQPVEGLDWWESSWFGSYYAPDTNQWIMHSELTGSIRPSMEAGVWLWKDGLKWLWTDSKTFPFLHSIDQDHGFIFMEMWGRRDCSMPTLPKNGSFWKTESFRKIPMIHKIQMIRIILNRFWITIRLSPQIITRLEVSKSQNHP